MTNNLLLIPYWYQKIGIKKKFKPLPGVKINKPSVTKRRGSKQQPDPPPKLIALLQNESQTITPQRNITTTSRQMDPHNRFITKEQKVFPEPLQTRLPHRVSRTQNV
jgi:hypothetical protein